MTTCRSRLLPSDVGLPCTARRRVPGLRRDEVAELAGVSVDWYRWFESGRPVRISPRLIARLAAVLQMSASDELTLFRLALPEIYHANARAGLQGGYRGDRVISWSESVNFVQFLAAG